MLRLHRLPQRQRILRAAGRSLPFVLLAAGAVADLMGPDVERFDRLLYAAPPLAASTWGWRATTGIGLLTMVVVAFLAGSRDLEVFSEPVAFQAALLLIITAASAVSAYLRTTREKQLRTLHLVADAAQRAVLRPMPARLGTIDLHLLYQSSATGARVGGDFYKALKTPGAVRLILGDVQGKGLEALDAAEVLLGSFRESAYTAATLPEIAARLELSMVRFEERDTVAASAHRFATVLLVEIPDDEPVIRVLSCGHPPPLLQHHGRTVTLAVTSSLPVNLGVAADDAYEVTQTPFEPGDRMLMYTDGVSETRDPMGEFYPLAERLAQWALVPAEEVAPLLNQDLVRYSGHSLDDDTSAVLIVRTDRRVSYDTAAGAVS
ncbi:PP2C family protein-serine/threonine phosphatase [Streptomyces sp. NPDC057682]|uniref:PP2C family protein-serine/threonine phosphatase n=1 Tax=Streptomyces sp. NPDC057682 TaxID=3346210 RepID=UPI0036951CEC